MITHDNIFTGCENLKHVDLVEEAVLRDTIAALHLEEWKNEMMDEIGAINQSLLAARAGSYSLNHVGGKALAIRMWIASVLRNIVQCKAQHTRSRLHSSMLCQIMISCSRMSFLFSHCHHTRLKERIRRGEGGDIGDSDRKSTKAI